MPDNTLMTSGLPSRAGSQPAEDVAARAARNLAGLALDRADWELLADLYGLDDPLLLAAARALPRREEAP